MWWKSWFRSQAFGGDRDLASAISILETLQGLYQAQATAPVRPLKKSDVAKFVNDHYETLRKRFPDTSKDEFIKMFDEDFDAPRLSRLEPPGVHELFKRMCVQIVSSAANQTRPTAYFRHVADRSH